MYKRVSPWKFWLLTYVTLGIYPMVVWYRMTENLNDMANKVGEKPICGYITSLLLGIVTCGIYSIIWIFKFFGLMSRLNARASVGISPSGPFLMTVMSFIPIFSFFWLSDAHNKLADAYEGIR